MSGENLTALNSELMDVRVEARDLSRTAIEGYKPIINRAVGSALANVRKYVPGAYNSVRNFFKDQIIYNLEDFHRDEVGGYFVPDTNKLVANIRMLRKNASFFVEALYHEAKHAARKATGAMENLYRGFVNEAGPFLGSLLHRVYEEGAASALTEDDLGRTQDSYGLPRAAVRHVEKKMGSRVLVENNPNDVPKILNYLVEAIQRYASQRRAPAYALAYAR